MTIDLRKPQQTPPRPIRMSDTVHERSEPMHQIARARSPRKRQERAVFMFAAGVIALLVVVLLGFGISKAWGYFFGGSEYEVRALVSDVGELMLLPSDETPTLATVTDLHALEGQLFFKNAAEGDKVLMYMRSQKAILYRPSIGKIIEVGPITGSGE